MKASCLVSSNQVAGLTYFASSKDFLKSARILWRSCVPREWRAVVGILQYFDKEGMILDGVKFCITIYDF